MRKTFCLPCATWSWAIKLDSRTRESDKPQRGHGRRWARCWSFKWNR